MKIERRGVILTDNVDIDWLKSLEPQFFSDFIKFVVNPKTNKVCIGMSVHACCMPEMGDNKELLGGNLFY